MSAEAAKCTLGGSALGGGEALLEVGDDVVDVLDPNGQAGGGSDSTCIGC